MDKTSFALHLSLKYLHRSMLVILRILFVLWLAFIVGTIFKFADTSQIYLLRALSTSAILTFTVSFSEILLRCYFVFVKKEKQRITLQLKALFALLFGLASAIVSIVILIFAKGM